MENKYCGFIFGSGVLRSGRDIVIPIIEFGVLDRNNRVFIPDNIEIHTCCGGCMNDYPKSDDTTVILAEDLLDELKNEYCKKCMILGNSDCPLNNTTEEVVFLDEETPKESTTIKSSSDVDVDNSFQQIKSEKTIAEEDQEIINQYRKELIPVYFSNTLVDNTWYKHYLSPEDFIELEQLFLDNPIVNVLNIKTGKPELLFNFRKLLIALMSSNIRNVTRTGNKQYFNVKDLASIIKKLLAKWESENKISTTENFKLHCTSIADLEMDISRIINSAPFLFQLEVGKVGFPTDLESWGIQCFVCLK